MKSRVFVLVAFIAALLSRTESGNTQEKTPKPKAAKLKSVARLGGFKDWVTSAAWSPDGKTIATGSYDKLVLWNGESFEQIKDVQAKMGRFRALVFSRDSSKLYAGGFRKIGVFDAKTGEELKVLAGHKAYITSVALSADGKTLASSSEDATVRIWNLESGESSVFMEEEEDPVMGVAISPDGKLVATASGDDTRPSRPGHIKLWNAESGELIKELEQHKRVATGVEFSPDGTLLASTSQDEIVYIHDVKTHKLVSFYEEHGRPTNGASFLGEGKHLISIAGGRAVGKNEVHVWDVKNGTTAAKGDTHKGPILGFAVSPDGKHVVTASRNASAIVWSLAGVVGPKPNPLTDLVNKADAAIKNAQKTQKKDDAPTNKTKKDDGKLLRIGMIGLDTSHCLRFTELLNLTESDQHVAGCRVVAVYPKGSPDIQSSVSRVPKYTEEIKKLGVEVVDSIEEMVKDVDAVLLETNDGRPHLEQIIPVLKAGKPVFVDKPIAGSLADAIAIFALAEHYKTPVFSSSSLRFSNGPQAIRNGSLGDVTGCDTFSPCSLEKTHPDLFWYGIHGVEMLFTVMGAGCEQVQRASTEHYDLATGVWKNGRIGTFRGIRKGSFGYGGTAFGTKGKGPVGKYDGYRPLVVEIVKFFQTGKPPVDKTETLNIYAFMEAADESKRQGGAVVKIADVMAKATNEAKAKIEVVIKADTKD